MQNRVSPRSPSAVASAERVCVNVTQKNRKEDTVKRSRTAKVARDFAARRRVVLYLFFSFPFHTIHREEDRNSTRARARDFRRRIRR